MKLNSILGYFIAFLLIISLTCFLWSFIFVKGNLAPNILLAFTLACFSIYYLTIYLGNFFNDYIFNGGSIERAITIRKAKKILRSNKNIKILIKKKIQRPEKLLAILENLSILLKEICKNWITTKEKREKQTENLLKIINLINEKLNKSLNKKNKIKGLGSFILAFIFAIGLRSFFIEAFQIPSGSMIPTLLIGDHLFVSKLSYGIINPFSQNSSYFIKWDNPKQGDVVVFEAPNYSKSNAGESWIKRVIAVPGQRISIKNTLVYVDGKVYPHITRKKLVSYMNYVSTKKQKFWHKSQSIETVEDIIGKKHKIISNPPLERYAYENDWPLDRMIYPGLKCNINECKIDDGYLFVMGDNRGNSADSRIWGALPIDKVKGKALFIWMSVDASKSILNISNFWIPKFRWKRWFSLIL